MVSFSCENCGDVLTKKKLDQHRGRCRGASFTCIDCMVHFPGCEYRTHTTCMTEDQKYQGALYKTKKQRGTNNNTRHNPRHTLEPLNEDMVPAHAYVEDAPEDGRHLLADDGNSPPEILFEAPTPPPAVPEPPTINVFDFLVDAGTLDMTHVNFMTKDDNQLVRYDYENDAYIDDEGYMVDDNNDALVRYGTGPIPSAEAFQTPTEKPKKSNKAEPKTDKKRKRLCPETKDQVMTDAPPVLHSGLTSVMDRMMQYPPSPEFSGDGNDSGDAPASPTKKTKHKHNRHKSTSSAKSAKNRHRSESISNGLLALVGGAAKPNKKRKVTKKKSSRSNSTRHRRDSEEKEKPSAKLLEYSPGARPSSRDRDHHHSHHNQMVLYRPRADLFLSLVNKGPESERGCSVNKALKRFHRERSSSRETREGRSNKSVDEKELWRSLRMRRNDRGEIVLFSLDDEE